MYGNSYFTPSGLFLSVWGNYFLGITVPYPFSAGPVLLMKPPCCEHGGNSTFAGHLFSAIPTKSAVGDRSGKFPFEKWQFRKKFVLKVRMGSFEVADGPGYLV